MKWSAWRLALLVIGFQYAAGALCGLAPYINFEKGYAFVYRAGEYRLAFPNDGEAVGYELSILPRESGYGARGIHISFLESDNNIWPYFLQGEGRISGTVSRGGAEGIWTQEGEYERLILTDGGQRLICAEAVFAGTEEENARDCLQMVYLAETFTFFSPRKEGIPLLNVE